MNIIFKVICLFIIVGVVAACTPPILLQPDDFGTETGSSGNNDIQTKRPLLTSTLENKPTATRISTIDSSLKVLFIGNSYTFSNNLPEKFEKLINESGYDIEVGQSTYGGWSLSQHSSSSETIEKIANTNWDYVILQEQSTVTNPEIGMYPAVRVLNTQIENIGAETILFMTWGRQDGLESAGYPDYESMQTEIVRNYKNIASELDLMVAPIGLAWQEVHTQNPNIQLWDSDGSHPSEEGSYLAAIVLYAVITHNDSVRSENPARILQETAQILQQAAFASVFENVQDSRERIFEDKNQSD